MNNSTVDSSRGGGVGLPVVVFVVFLILKLLGVITWSWWWVVSPLLIGWGLGLIILFGLLIAYQIAKRR